MKAAQKQATTFLKESQRPLQLQEPPAKTLKDADGTPLCYIFNTIDGEGFVVAAANEADGILAYSTNGAYDEATAPPNLKAWLEACRHQLTAQQRPKARKAKPRFVPQDKILPLIATRWDQGTAAGNAYNLLAPIVDDSTCVAGCVATALAQVMRYHQWPTDTCRGIPAYDSGRPGVLDSLPPARFAWELMATSYEGSESEEEIQAIAQLMLYCGHATKTLYTPKRSEAYGSDATKALIDIFDYPNAKYVKCADFDDDTWNRMIYNELSSSRPVVYFGYSSVGGHCFVCDGYDSNDFYHINWGWGGRGDGYYKLSMLHPTETGEETVDEMGYSLNQYAIIGIARNAAASDNIHFADSVAKRICVENWDANEDGELSKEEAAAVRSLSGVFEDDSTLTSFNELCFFTSLQSVGKDAFKNCRQLKAITLPVAITEIGDHAFEGCALLEAITIPENVFAIGKGIFDGCSRLTSIDVAPDNPIYDSRDHCNAIVFTAENRLVVGCAATIIPTTITEIGQQAFMNCKEISIIELPEGIVEIGNEAFEGCSGLNELELPASMQLVGNRAFANCKGLTRLHLPADLSVVGNGAFAGCSALTTIWTDNPQPPQCGSNAFLRCRAMVYVPTGSKELYMEADEWRELIIVEEDDSDLLYAADIAFTKSKAGTLYVGMRNTSSVIGLQFTLRLPEGLSIRQHDGDYDITLTDRTSRHELYCNQNADGSYRLLMLSMQIDEIADNGGDIMAIAIEAADSIEAGDYTCEFADIVLSTIDGMEISGVRLTPFFSNIKVREFDLGDVNVDRKVDIADVMLTVCHIINLPAEAFHEENADLNSDKSIDVIDVMRIIQVVLTQPVDEEEPEESLEEGTLANQAQLTATSANTFVMETPYPDLYTAMEMTVVLPRNARLAAVKAEGNRHRTLFARQSDGSYRVVVYSADGTPFDGRTTRLVSLTTEGAEGQARISHVVCTNSRFESIPIGAASATTQIVDIKADNTADEPAYNLSGQRVADGYKGIVVRGGVKQVR